LGFEPKARTAETIAVLFLIMVLSFGWAGAGEIKDFKSDGCSLFPDRSLITGEDWCLCCFQHDLAYWQGGTADQRLAADKALRDCILKQTGNTKLAEMMYVGVRFGGSPYFYNWYRWGYGWGYERKYAPLSKEEKTQVRQKLKRYFADPPRHFCP
jgi:hypothetical protein